MHIWQLEADATWTADPWPLISKLLLTSNASSAPASGYDIVSMSDQMPPRKFLNGGFFYARPSPKNIRTWTSL